jgi:hypothetical protein
MKNKKEPINEDKLLTAIVTAARNRCNEAETKQEKTDVENQAESENR